MASEFPEVDDRATDAECDLARDYAAAVLRWAGDRVHAINDDASIMAVFDEALRQQSTRVGTLPAQGMSHDEPSEAVCEHKNIEQMMGCFCMDCNTWVD